MRCGGGVLLLALATPASAQVTSDALGIERFRLSIDRSGVLDVDSADVPKHGSWSGGLVVGFAHDPLVVYSRSMEPIEAIVDRRLTTGLVGAIALWDRVQIGAGIDLVGYQHGASEMDLPTTGLGDARLVVKLRLFERSRVAVALVPTLTVPAGGARGFLREDGVTFAPALAISTTRDRVRAALNLGYRLKPRVETAGLVSDDEAFARAGVGVQLAPAEVWWSASIAAPLTDRTQNRTAIESLVGAVRDVSRAVGVFVAGGVGLQNGFGTPDWRALAGVRFEPRAPKLERVVIAPPTSKPVDEPPREPVVEAPKPAKLAGRVTDREGRPIPRANVTIGAIEVVADDIGRFSTEYAGGATTVSARAPQYQANAVEANVPPGEAGEVDVVLARAARQGQLRGQVLSFAGKPLPATITVGDNHAQTDADGKYSIDLPAGSYQVVIESAGHATQKKKIKVRLDSVTVLNVDMRGVK